MLIEHRGLKPRLGKDVYIAPNAAISGDVEIGAGSCVLYGAVLTSEGGPIRVGRDCVIMENAVLRGAPGAALTIGDNVLVGPRAYLTGCTVEDSAFLAAGSTVFNQAVIGARAEVRINAVVHLKTYLPVGCTVPIGWVAVGHPVQILPPDRHEAIWEVQKTLDFPGTVFGMERPKDGKSLMPTVMPRYAKALRRHLQDKPLD